MVTARDIMFWMITSSVFSRPLSEEQKNSINSENLLEAYNLANGHAMPHLFLPALKLNDMTELCPEIIPRAKKAVYFASVTTSMQQEELLKIVPLFEENKIPFIVLKGTVIRNYYPEVWMRISCDIDILVKKSDFDKARKLLVDKLEYESEQVMTHDVSLTAKSGVHTELHFDLIEKEFSEKAADILSGVWENGYHKSENSYEYIMSDEMFYFYHIAHAAKHFEEGGCGLRPLLDLYILGQQNIDTQKCDKLLEKGNLKTFEEAIVRLAYERFGKEKAELDEYLQNVEDFIIAGKTFGTVRTNAITYAVKKGKADKVFTLIFPHYEKMALLYPVLQKHKWLLPFMWVFRWFKAIFEGRAELSMERIKIAQNLEQESIDQAAKLLKDLKLNN